jgi:type IV pilus assembly protein PilM
LPIKLFSKKKAPMIGLDVSPTAITMVELGYAKSGLCIERFAVEPIDSNVYMDSNVVRADELSEAISRCHSKLKSKTKAVAMGLPAESTFIKRLTISSALGEEEMEKEVGGALSALMLIDVADISVDFQPLDPSVSDDVSDELEEGSSKKPELDPSLQEVLAMAAKRTKVDDLLVPIENAGLRVGIVDSQTIAIHTLLDEIATKKGESVINKNLAVVQFSDQSIRFLVLRNGEAIYTRDAMFGLSQLVSDVIMRFGLSEEDAKKVINGAMSEPDGYDELLKQHVETATQEVHRAMQLFMTSTSYVGVETIFLHGEGCLLQGLPESIGESLSMACKVLDPLEGLSIAPTASGAVDQAHRLIVACGLAYRRFDL